MKLLIIIAGLLIAGSAFAGPFLIADPQCKFDGDNGCAAGFEMSLDGVAWESMGSQDVDTDKIMIHHDLAGFPEGINNVQVKAVNIWGESDPVPFSFTKSVPSTPTNIAVLPE